MSRRKFKYLLFGLPELIGVFVFMIIPLIGVVMRSVTDTENNISPDNFKNVFNNKSFRIAAINNIWFDMAGITLLMVISFIAAYLIYDKRNTAILFVLLFPLAVPSNASAALWNSLLGGTGVLSGKSAFVFIVCVFVWKYIGLNVLLWCVSLKKLPPEMLEAAALDGAGRLMTIVKMILPNLKKTTFILFILSFVNSFKIFREVYTLQGAYPDSHIYMVQHVFNNWFSALDMRKLAAGSVLVIVFVIAVFIIFRILLRER